MKTHHLTLYVASFLLTFALVGGVVFGPQTHAVTEEQPNLEAFPAEDIQLTTEDGKEYLRFSTISWNKGDGPLELVAGEVDNENKKQKVYQRVYLSDGSYYKNFVGEFTWHESHDHFHLDEYADYILQPVDAPGASERIGQKTSFCIMDTDRIDHHLDGASKRPVYDSCSDDIQGMSVGWGDEYGYQLAGQSIEVTDLPDGDYVLKIDVDPKGRLIEKSTDENTSSVRIRMKDGEVFKVEDQTPSVSITNPDDGTTVSGTTTFSADASDDGGVDRVEFYADDSLVGEATTTPYEINWDSTTVQDGSHTLTAKAVDTASQESSESISVTVDNVNDEPVADAGSDQTVTASGDGTASVTLDGSSSYDPDGSIVSYAWYEGGSLLATGTTPTVDLSLGDYTIDLEVTDDQGATSSDSTNVSVVEDANFDLSANAYKQKGNIFVDLSWTPTDANQVDVYRDGSVIATVSNDSGFYSDDTGAKGNTTFEYQVCEAGTTVCSNTVTASTK